MARKEMEWTPTNWRNSAYNIPPARETEMTDTAQARRTCETELIVGRYFYKFKLKDMQFFCRKCGKPVTTWIADYPQTMAKALDNHLEHHD